MWKWKKLIKIIKNFYKFNSIHFHKYWFYISLIIIETDATSFNMAGNNFISDVKNDIVLCENQFMFVWKHKIFRGNYIMFTRYWRVSIGVKNIYQFRKTIIILKTIAGISTILILISTSAMSRLDREYQVNIICLISIKIYTFSVRLFKPMWLLYKGQELSAKYIGGTKMLLYIWVKINNVFRYEFY